VIEWESYHHDNRNTGLYDVALDQGGDGAPTPLTEEMCAPIGGDDDGGDDLDVSGGCRCRAAANNQTTGAALAALALAGLLRRRRARDARRHPRG